MTGETPFGSARLSCGTGTRTSVHACMYVRGVKSVLACAERHFFWASALLGYFCYDAFHILYTGSAAGAGSMLLHHAVGLACCAVGLQGRMAYFGAAMQVIFEATTPLLHAAGCLRLMGLEKSRLYAVTGEAHGALSPTALLMQC